MTRQSHQLRAEADYGEDELALEGSRFTAGRLADFARIRIGYAEEDEAELAAFGFDAMWRSLLEQHVSALAEQKSVRVAASSNARPSGSKVDTHHAALEAWIKRYNVVVHNGPRAIAEKAPRVGYLGKRPAHIADTVKSYADFIEAHAKDTQAAGGGAAFARAGHDLVTQFSEERAAHKSDLGKISPGVKKLHVVEGVVAIELERLSKAAHSGVLSQERAALYALTGLRSAHRRHAPTGKPSTPSGGPTTPSGASA